MEGMIVLCLQAWIAGQDWGETREWQVGSGVCKHSKWGEITSFLTFSTDLCKNAAYSNLRKEAQVR